MALTDTNRMSGLILFYKACRAQGIHIKPILGMEVDEPGRPGETIVALARNAKGYGDLCEIATLRQRDRASFARIFAREWPDLILLTAYPRALKALHESPNRARTYGELVRHSAEARERSKGVAALCEAWKMPVAASGDCSFLDPKEHELHRVLRAIDLNSTLSRLKPGETAPEGAWFRSDAQMAELFRDRPDALENAGCIADACRVELDLGKWIMPDIQPRKPGYTADVWLSRLACRGLWRKYGNKPAFAEARRIQEMELSVIRKLGYSSYFLMVKEVRDWATRALGSRYRRARDCSILRGSGANSITFYNLGVCNLDPIALNLYFQRFLNEDRAAPPDADLDFGWDERDRALKWMVERFGRDRVAITCTTNHFRGKAAFREVAKVFGYSEGQATAVLDSFNTQSRQIIDDEVLRIGEWARQVRGRPRFLGQHPGGLIVTNEPIFRHVGCEWSRTAEGGSSGDARLITQIDMHNGIDDLGLIKFDLLGNGSISVLRDSLAQLEEAGYPDPEVWDVEKCFRDPKVNDMIKNGRTRGIFYIESPAQIRLNQRAKAESFDEIVITSSLIRPAGTAYCDTFVERHRKMKSGVKDWAFLHSSLEGLLSDTHDVCAFQEDVIRICHDVAGLSFKLADRIRKMMNSAHEGAPEAAEWERVKGMFIDGCMGRAPDPFTRPQAEALWTRVSSFTGFSFCKSHSASYAELSFQCSHLKAHYPAQFLSAVITNRHGFYTRDVYLDEARRWGLRILPLDVNHSRLAYHGRDKWIRPGLVPVRDCRETALKVLVQARETDGPYRDLPDLLRRVPLHKREAENLILAGAMGGFGMTQPELLYQLDAAYGHARGDQSDLFGGTEVGARAAGPGSTLGEGRRAAGLPGALEGPGLREYSLMQKCLNELRMLGYVLSANLLDVVENHPLARGAVRAAELGRHVGRRVKILGIPVTDRLHPVADSGRYMKFLTLGDKTGYFDIIFWPDMLDKWGDTLAGQAPFAGNLLEVWGKVGEQSGTYSLEAERVRVAEWLPNQVDFESASRRLHEGMRDYPAYAGGVEALAA
ncbi:MAG: DNA polymerase III subunit alpha [Fibrobacteres bacterium]|nr:DNA polymerase III subunit alpha [Fibrobacterota bacterium]